MLHRALSFAALALPLVVAGGAAAQSRYTQSQVPGTPPMLQRVDPTLSDVSPLGDSLRDVNMQADLRAPTGFQHVYRVPGRDDLLMRASGGVYAIFPQSTYLPTAQGMAATVPPGTVYSIGLPGPWALSSRWMVTPNMLPMDGTRSPTAAAAPAGMRYPIVGSEPVDDRRGIRQGGHATTGAWTADGAPSLESGLQSGPVIESPRVQQTQPPEPSTFLKTVVTDDEYRARRLAELLQAAVEASRRSGQ